MTEMTKLQPALPTTASPSACSENMSDYNSFYEAVENHGGVLDLANLPTHLQELADFARDCCIQTRNKINASKILWPLGDARVEMVNNAGFNAFAHHDNGFEGIAIYSGLFKHLCELSIDLWSGEGLLCSARVGWRANETLLEFLPRKDIEQWQTVPKNILDEQHLFQRRINTALTGFFFIFMHEVGHLVKAHIPFLNKRTQFGFKTLFEGDNDMDRICSTQELQYFEMDADSHAIRGVTDFALTTWGMGKVFPINYPYPKGDIFSYLVDIYRGVILAIFCLDQNSASKELVSHSSHPVPGVRLGVTYLESVNLLRHPFKVDEKLVVGAFIAAAMEIGDLFTKKRLPAFTLEHDFNVLLQKAGQMFIETIDFSQGFQLFINERLQRMGRDPRHFDQFKDFYKKQ